MTPKPLVSFVIPVYNTASYLEKCISSVLKQSYEDYEIIAVNDGSTDNCGEILEQISKQDSRIRVINKKNGGVSSARNAGIAAAKGSWIYFLDSDDSLLPDSIGKVIPYLDDHYDLVMTDLEYADQHQIKSGVKTTISNELDLTREFDIIGWTIFPVWGKFYKKEMLVQNNLRFDEDMIGNEDQAFTLTWMAKVNAFLVLHNQTYCYYIREGSFCHSTRDPRMEMRAYDYYCSYLERNPKIVEESTLFCDMFIGYAVYKKLEGLALDCKMTEMAKIMENALVIRALPKVSFTQKDKLLVCKCIEKKDSTKLAALFILKNVARKVKPIFNCIKKITR